uniref:Uncharacterized protein n=1 Tax=Vibrio genomosp. F6 TaxID=723172 RepID=A0A0H3ZTF7_9VIBR|nr:hypothetical protein [Vibrio genomosp. F6]
MTKSTAKTTPCKKTAIGNEIKNASVVSDIPFPSRTVKDRFCKSRS